MVVGSLEIQLGNRPLRVLLADLQEHLSPSRLADHLYSRHGHELTVADALIIRPPVDHGVEDVASVVKLMQPIFERVAKLPIYVLTSHAFIHHLSDNIHPKTDGIFDETERALLIPLLRRKELANIVDRTKAIFYADGATIFRTPSKSFCYRFFRAGNVQVDRATLDVFFFWMLPWLKNCRAVVAETWTISSIVLNATRLLARYAPTQGRCKVELLSDYYDGSPEAEFAAELAFDRVLRDTKGVALVVFSACMTGNAVERLRKLVGRHCDADLAGNFGSLYNLQPALPIDCLCELYEEFPGEVFRHHKELPVPEEEILVIDIDKTLYFPSIIKQGEIHVDRSCSKYAALFALPSQ